MKQMLGIAVNKQLKKEYDNRIVYLNNGDEFQLMLFNPTTFKIGAIISLNGVRIPGMVILKPGERIWLDRYLDKNLKFKFSTYSVENSTDAKNAISENGKVSVRFFYELNSKPYMICDSFNQNLSTSINISPYNPYGITWTSNNLCSYENNNANCITASYYNNVTTAAEIETGRIDEGSYSSQNLAYDNSEFNNISFSEENITILPISRKPYNKNDINRKYCTNCGKRLNPKYKYCPTCGTKI